MLGGRLAPDALRGGGCRWCQGEDCGDSAEIGETDAPGHCRDEEELTDATSAW